MEPTREDVAWFAGLFEGEGSLSRCRPMEDSAWKMALRMTDRDVMERIHQLFGGKLYENKWRGKPSHKQCWSWQLGVQSEINRVVDLIYPYMGARRRERMDMFRAYFAKPMPTMSERSAKNWRDPVKRAQIVEAIRAAVDTPAWREKNEAMRKECLDRGRAKMWSDPDLRDQLLKERAARPHGADGRFFSLKV